MFKRKLSEYTFKGTGIRVTRLQLTICNLQFLDIFQYFLPKIEGE